MSPSLCGIEQYRGNLDTNLLLSLERSPITGSIAAEIKFCASFTRHMASSISRWAASLLLV